MNFKSLTLAAFATVMTLGAAAPMTAEAGPRCGQYDTHQERQICRGLRDGIRREIREDRRDRWGRHGWDRRDRWERRHGWNRWDRNDGNTRRRIEEGLADGLADLIRGR